MTGLVPHRRPMARQTKWKVKMYQRGRCINCGRSRDGSPYKRKCVICAELDRERRRRREGGTAWQPGRRGRPPKTART